MAAFAQLCATKSDITLLTFDVQTGWRILLEGSAPMTNSASSLMAILFGLAVFAVIVAVGWRSVQNRRILRLQDANGHETIVIAREGDDVRSVVTTTETDQDGTAVSSSAISADSLGEPSEKAEFGRGPDKGKAARDAEAEAAGRDRLNKMVSSTR